MTIRRLQSSLKRSKSRSVRILFQVFSTSVLTSKLFYDSLFFSTVNQTHNKAYLDLLPPIERFSLTESGLTGKALSSARSISVLWANDKWLTQEPLSRLSPISLSSPNVIARLRELATLNFHSHWRSSSRSIPSRCPQSFETCNQTCFCQSK